MTWPWKSLGHLTSVISGNSFESEGVWRDPAGRVFARSSVNAVLASTMKRTIRYRYIYIYIYVYAESAPSYNLYYTHSLSHPGKLKSPKIGSIPRTCWRHQILSRTLHQAVALCCRCACRAEKSSGQQGEYTEHLLHHGSDEIVASKHGA